MQRRHALKPTLTPSWQGFLATRVHTVGTELHKSAAVVRNCATDITVRTKLSNVATWFSRVAPNGHAQSITDARTWSDPSRVAAIFQTSR